MAALDGDTFMKQVDIFTDGSCLGNPGPGGWAAVLRYAGTQKELGGGFSGTTNNRMEILAVIEGLEALQEPCTVNLYTDSQYVRNAVEKKWLDSWQRNGWKTAARKPVKNKDLWLRLLPLLARHTVKFHWVRGHSGHPENELCDTIARGHASRGGLPPDTQAAG
ncbi:Ribonuclease H [Oleidesulfovibrio alaskensis G20]|nr:Ribonuclease H [Oleidesulfovibrio alaskensis G20]